MHQIRIPLLSALILAIALPAAGQQKKGSEAAPKFSWVNSIGKGKAFANLPKGLKHATFTSPSMKQEVGYCIYLPEAYEAESDRKFPTVFHLHGGRPGSELKSMKLAKFVDAAIRKEAIQPTIYVFPNGGPMSWYNYPQIENGLGEDVFVKELIPHIKETYRTRELAIEGFSQGGRGTTRIMFRYPELFVSAAPGGSGYSNEKRVQENDGAESERVVFAKGYNTWDMATEYAKHDNKVRLPILLWVGSKGFNYENNLEFSKYLESLSLAHEKHVVEGIDHSAYRLYEKDGMPLMQFHQKHFSKPE